MYTHIYIHIYSYIFSCSRRPLLSTLHRVNQKRTPRKAFVLKTPRTKMPGNSMTTAWLLAYTENCAVTEPKTKTNMYMN